VVIPDVREPFEIGNETKTHGPADEKNKGKNCTFSGWFQSQDKCYHKQNKIAPK
jgi:hypothetical protein